MIYAKKFKNKLKVNVHKLNASVSGPYIETERVLEWIDKQWMEFLEQQIIPRPQKRRA